MAGEAQPEAPSDPQPVPEPRRTSFDEESISQTLTPRPQGVMLKTQRSVKRLKPGKGLNKHGDIAVLGVAQAAGEKAKTLDKLLSNLDSRGFEVMLFTPDPREQGQSFILVIRVSLDLAARIAPRMAMTVHQDLTLSPMDRATIVTTLLDSVKRALDGYVHKDILLMHDEDQLKEVLDSGSSTHVAQYVGSEVALYFEWITFYTRLLLPLSVAGVILFLIQTFWKEETVWSPVFNIGLAVWGTVLLELWKRRNARKCFEWGLYDKPEALTKARELGGDKAEMDRQYSALFLYGVSLPITGFIVILLVKMMLYFVWMSDSYIETYGPGSNMQYIPMALYSSVPPLAQWAYSQVVVIFNDWEGHNSPEAYQASLQLKQFAFHFVNSYCSLFYIAFWLQDMARLRGMLLSLLGTKQIVGNLSEFAGPLINGWMNEANNDESLDLSGSDLDESVLGDNVEGKIESMVKKAFIKMYRGTMKQIRPRGKSVDQEREAFNKAVEEAKAAGVLKEAADILAAVELQRGYAPYQVDDEHIEILVQFGYVSMFAMAFPLAPLGALLNNLWEAKLDLLKLKVSRRPQCKMTRDLGGWYTALEVMGFIAVLTNCLLMALISDQVQVLIPDALHFLLESGQGRFLLALMVEHGLLALKFFLAAVIPDVPEDVQRELDRRAAAVREDLAPTKSRRGMSTLSLKRSPVSGSSYAGGSGVSAAAVQGKLTATELRERLDSGTWPYSPLSLGPILLAPYVSSWMGFSPLWVLPVGFFVLSYLHNLKVRQDRKTAIQLASDPRTIKAITKHLPNWYFDSQIERTVWLSQVLQKLWIHVSGMTEKIVLDVVNPILDGYKPAMINQLRLMKCDLGNVAPVVTGVRYVESTEELVRLDIDISWAGNPDVVLEVGYKGMPLVLQLSKIQFRGKVRVELNPLTSEIPGFAAICCTFMKPPFVDFSFKVGKLDLMAVGVPDMSVADVVANIIRENILRDFLVYPAQLVIPMLEQEGLDKLQRPDPIGRLMVTIISGRELKVADIRSSDPYVVVEYGPPLQKYKTKVKQATLEPKWGEECNFDVYDKTKAEPLKFEVYDHDLVGSHDSLGCCSLPLQTLKEMVPTEIEMKLEKVKTGYLKVSVCLVPLSRPGDDDEAEKAEVDDDEDNESLTDPTDAGHLSDDTSVDGEVSALPAVSLGPKMASTKGSFDVTGGLTELPAGVLTIDSFQLLGYPGRHSLIDRSKVFLRFSLGSIVKQTSAEKNPTTNPDFKDTLTFTVQGVLVGTSLELAVVESYSMKGLKMLGTNDIDLTTFTKRAGKKVESEWPIDYKGRVFRVKMRAIFTPMAVSTATSASGHRASKSNATA